MKIAELLRIAVEKKGISQVEIARRMGVSQPYVSRVFKDEKMNTDHWDRIREAAGLTLAEVFEGNTGEIVEEMLERLRRLEEQSQVK